MVKFVYIHSNFKTITYLIEHVWSIKYETGNFIMNLGT